MKSLISAALLALSLSFTVSAQEDAPADFVFDLYQFCLSAADEEAPNKDAEVLTCINEDLTYNQYRTFESLSAVLSYIKDYLEE